MMSASPRCLGLMMMQSRQMLFPNDLCGIFLFVFAATICILSHLLWKGYRWRPHQLPPSHFEADIVSKREVPAPSPIEPQFPKSKNDSIYRRLFFQLHNIEKHPEVLKEARNLLISLLSEALNVAKPDRRQDIFAIERFCEEQLFAHVRKAHEQIGEEYERYVEGRAAGNGRLMVADRQQAAKVLTNLAPLKLVDGAWLGRIHQIMTPFALRPITKQAWQVLSEELGDGDLELNHVYLFNKLLHEVGVRLPAPHDPSFTDLRHGMDNELVWRAAVTQLLISLFPQDFLPEILGYSLHFEGLSMETMVLSRELQELKLDARYFLLHVSIDNAHSGHAMMTAHTVAAYMTHIIETETDAVATTTWRRIQAGYALSAYQGRSIEENLLTTANPPSSLPGRYDAEIVRMLVAKAAVAQKTHSACCARIKGKPLAQWLDPEVLESGSGIVQELSNAYPWVVKGRPQQSRLIREISRGGKMFGAFTVTETKLLQDWILSLAPNSQETETYWRFTNRSLESQQDVSPPPAIHCDAVLLSASLPLYGYVNICDRKLTFDLSHTDWTNLCGLWFAHLSLLENCVAIPSRAATDMGAAVIRVLRAQYSLSWEEDGVSGMDEIMRSSPPDLVAIGLEVCRRKGLMPAPVSLSDVLVRWPCAAADRILGLAQHPVANYEMLLGMAAVFVDLQRAVLNLPDCMDEQSAVALAEIIERETKGLRAACEGAVNRSLLSQGYQTAEEIVRDIIVQPSSLYRGGAEH